MFRTFWMRENHTEVPTQLPDSSVIAVVLDHTGDIREVHRASDLL